MRRNPVLRPRSLSKCGRSFLVIRRSWSVPVRITRSSSSGPAGLASRLLFSGVAWLSILDMALNVGPYPAFDCGPLLGARCIVLGMRSATTNSAFLGAQAPSIWKFVFSDSQFHDGIEKAYNRVYSRARNVLGCVLSRNEAAQFRDLGGGAASASMIRITDLRSIYTCLNLHLDRLVARAPLGGGGLSFAGYISACRDRLSGVAVRVCCLADVVAHVGGNPFVLFTDLDPVHVAELKRYPVVLAAPVAVAPVGRVSDVGVGRAADGPVESSAEYLRRVRAARRDTGDPYDMPSDDEPPPPERPRYTEEQLQKEQEVGVAAAPVKDDTRVHDWGLSDMTGDALALLEKDGGVDIEVLLHAVRHPEVAQPDDFYWMRRKRAGRGRRDKLVAAQLKCVNRWAKCPGSAVEESQNDRGPEPPTDWLQPLGASSGGEALKPHHWNGLVWALSHKGIAEQVELGPPRLEYLAVDGVFPLVKRCFAVGGTAYGGPASASSLVAACTGWIYGMQYLWNRAALHLSKCKGDIQEDVRTLPLILAERVRAARSSLKSLIKIHKGDERHRASNKRTRMLVGDDVVGLGSVRAATDLQRQEKLLREMPDAISTLVLDVRATAQKALMYRELKSRRMVRDFAFEMQDVIVRCTAASFMLCHVRPSLVEVAEVYLTNEVRPECLRCQRNSCSATSFLVHPQEDKLVFIAEHHKGNKGQASGEAILQRTSHHWLVVLFREWAMWGQALAYTGELPVDAFTEPELRPPRAVGVRRHLLMRAPKAGPQRGIYRPLMSGEATRLLRSATGGDYQHKDYRHAFITALQNVCLPLEVRENLVEKIRQSRALPEWVSVSAARCLGNSLAMWRSTYDHGESPVDAETTETVLDAARKHILLLSSLGKRIGDSIPDNLPDPEAELMRPTQFSVSFSMSVSDDDSADNSDENDEEATRE
jgi:hypothetical protein